MGNAVDAADNNGNYINDESDEKKQHQQTSILDKVSNGFSKLISNISQKAESSKQRFRYLVVLDFDATTGKEIKRSQREVIEWAAMIIDTKTNKILQGKKHKFHYYIRPQIHPELTKYCKKLTGITQQFIDEYGTRYEIRELTYKWNAWCCGNNLLPTSYHNSTPKACIITCGDNDLNEIWKSQAKISEVDSIDDVGLFHSWINIQEIFKQNITDYNGGCGLMSMLKHLNIDIEGRHHSAINDVENTCKIVLHLLAMDAVFDYTTSAWEQDNVWTMKDCFYWDFRIWDANKSAIWDGIWNWNADYVTKMYGDEEIYKNNPYLDNI